MAPSRKTKKASILQTYKLELIGAGAVLLLITLIIIFYPRAKPPVVDPSGYKELQQAYTDILKFRSDERRQDSIAQIKSREDIEYWKNEAKRLQKIISTNNQFYIDNEKKYRDLPNTVRRILSKDSLRAAIKIIKQ